MKIDEANKHIKKNGFIYVLTLRLIPLFPYNILNYALGLTRVKTKHYILGTVLGMIPGIFAYVYLGSNIFNVKSIEFWIAILVFVVVMVVPIIIKKKMRSLN